MAACQQCGRPATFTRPMASKYKGRKKKRRTIAQKDHDLCRSCWRKLMESVRSRE